MGEVIHVTKARVVKEPGQGLIQDRGVSREHEHSHWDGRSAGGSCPTAPLRGCAGRA